MNTTFNHKLFLVMPLPILFFLHTELAFAQNNTIKTTGDVLLFTLPPTKRSIWNLHFQVGRITMPWDSIPGISESRALKKKG